MASPQLAMIVNMMRSRPANPDATVAELRHGFEDITRLLPLAGDVTVDRTEAGGRPAEWVAAPGADPARVILYLHGGGYAIGSLNTHRDLASRLSRASGARALTVDYRLAPEHPHPAAVDDALAAYRWLLESAGVEARHVVVAGDSAGGGLSVATLLAARDAGLPLPAAGVCISPWVDLEGVGESMTTRAADDPIVQRDGLLRMAGWYLGGASPRTPLAAPLHADLAALPPLLVQVGTAETLLDDAARLATRAKDAGVDVTYEPWEDMIHVWHVFAAMLPEAEQAIARIGAFVRERTS
jgi:acetyl esterase/lipase